MKKQQLAKSQTAKKSVHREKKREKIEKKGGEGYDGRL